MVVYILNYLDLDNGTNLLGAYKDLDKSMKAFKDACNLYIFDEIYNDCSDKMDDIVEAVTSNNNFYINENIIGEDEDYNVIANSLNITDGEKDSEGEFINSSIVTLSIYPNKNEADYWAIINLSQMVVI